MTLHCLEDLKSTFAFVVIIKLNAAFMYASLNTHALFPWIESKLQWANTSKQLCSIPGLYLLLHNGCNCRSSRSAIHKLELWKSKIYTVTYGCEPGGGGAEWFCDYPTPRLLLHVRFVTNIELKPLNLWIFMLYRNKVQLGERYIVYLRFSVFV
jgi:hypothetical protein